MESINALNAVLPSGYTPYASVTDFTAKIGAAGTYDATTLWLLKFYSIGPLYTVWIAENKWRLNPSWSFATGA